jgi:iron complex outermembrane recepter protein
MERALSNIGITRAVAALCLGSAAGAAHPQDAMPSPPPEAGERVVVTGTRLRAVEAADAQDVHVYDRERIERSGRTTLADFLATVPEASLLSNESTFGATTIRLRGAREGSTLILINGRRTQATTGSAALIGFFDLNTIPLSMVERIDILPTGSSAIYGGEALAGVVNIVLRSGFTGADGTVGYKGADNTDEKLVFGGVGWKGERGSVSMMASYADRSSLSNADRDITANSDMRRFGGPNLGSRFFGTPATISAVSGNLPGLNATFAAVPAGSTGVGLTPADFAATAGIENTGSFNRYQDALLNAIRKGFFASGEYRLGSVDLFAELLASEFKFEGATTPPALLNTPVPASNAFNPFGTTVLAAGVVRGTEPGTRFTFSDALVRPVVGARGRVQAWDWEASLLGSRDRGGQHIFGQPNAAALTAALASSNPATALNPFVDGPMGSPQLIASIFREVSDTTWKGTSAIANAFARGPVMRLPAGPVDAVLGTEYERSSLARDMDLSRNAHAFFGELRVPILAAPGGDARRELLALQGAARRDDYSDFGAKTTGQAAFELRPLDSLLLRGTYATAFKPPTLYNLGAPTSSALFPLTDPQNGGQSVVVLATQGGNPDLAPTTSRSGTLGAVWSPNAVRGLNLTLTGWTLRIDNGTSLPSLQYIVDHEAQYPGRVVRGPSSASGAPGQILSVDGSFVNFGTMRERGLDGAIDWTFDTGYGRFTPAAAATYMTKFTGASSPGSAEVDRLSHANRDGVFAPRMKAIVSTGWEPVPAFKAWIAGRYVGRYYDYTPPRTIGDFWYFDATIDISLERALHRPKGSLGDLRLVVSATNLADKLPTWSTHFRGYDVYNYDLVGRTFFVRLQARM